MAKDLDSRSRLIAAAQKHIRSVGFHGTSIKDVLAQSDASSASLYHHFPGGKDQLMAEAVREVGVASDALLRAGLTDATVADMVQMMFALAADGLERSGFREGCPIGTPAADASASNEVIRHEVETALGLWHDTIKTALGHRGITPGEAARLADTILAAYEGAILLAKARHDVTVLHEVAETLIPLVNPPELVNKDPT